MGGPARPRNLGIKAAKNEWVCFLDSDDMWEKDKLLSCAEYTDAADLIYHDLYMDNGYGDKKKMISRKLKKNSFRDLLVNGNTIKTSGTCVRKNVLVKMGLFSEQKKLIAVEDYDLWLRIAQAGYHFCYISKFLGTYWAGGGNITDIGNQQIDRLNAVYETYLPQLNNHDRRLAERMKGYIIAKIYHEMGCFTMAIKLYRKALRVNSVSTRLKSFFFLTKALTKKRI